MGMNQLASSNLFMLSSHTSSSLSSLLGQYEVFLKENRVIVEHVNISKKAQRRTQENQQGGFIEIEMPIHRSNVMLVDKKTNKSTRIGSSILKDGTKVRISKRSGEVI